MIGSDDGKPVFCVHMYSKNIAPGKAVRDI